MKKTIVIGSGLSGMAAACYLAKAGHSVTVLEKNDTIGGRLRKFEAQGYTFDLGPSWYWMPEVFEEFFAHFGHKTRDFYELERLDPAYRVFFKDEYVDVPAGKTALWELFERYEPGSASKLKQFLAEAEAKYVIGTGNFVRKPGLSIMELLDKDIFLNLGKMHLLTSMRSYVRKYFKHPYLQQILEFPVLFLGATPQDTPALYSMMNHADLTLGTWYPKGGMYEIMEAMRKVAEGLGIQILTSQEVKKVNIVGNNIQSVETQTGIYPADIVVNSADYHHFEQELLPESHRRYSAAYWDSRVMAPSCLLYYVGISKRLPQLQHHSLFFDADFDLHAQEIYKQPAYPRDPLFYMSITSRTQPTAPEGHENLFILIPIATQLKDSEEMRELYFKIVMKRLEEKTGENILDFVDYKRTFAQSDFVNEYHAFKGNAYGLANTLKQTANLKPSIINPKVHNLFYTGHLTVPGPGMPPAIISGQVVSKVILERF